MEKGLVLVTGIFNVLHPGHLRLLKFARACGERLIVGVLSDAIAGNSAHVLENLRVESLRTNGLIDEVFLVKSSVVDEIRSRQPEIVVKGKEHEGNDNIELEALREYGGRIFFSSGEVVFSSIDLIRREFSLRNFSSVELPFDFMLRRGINKSDLKELIKKFQTLRVAVVGDTIVDEYITCDALGMSEEDPSIVVSPIESRKFIGGAAIVAAHAQKLGSSVCFISVVGDDDTSEFCRGGLENLGVVSLLVVDKTRPTTLKQRFRSKGKTLLRVSHLSQLAVSPEIQEQIFRELAEKIKDFDLVILSDFNYGVLPQNLVDRITRLCDAKGIPVVADSQSSSQVGDIARFKGMTLITPTEREARLALKNNEAGLAVLGESLSQIARAKNVILKLGEDGALIHVPLKNGKSWDTDRIPALNSDPKDVAGAGDCLLVASSLVLCVGGTIWEAACIGSIAAAVQVGRVGNTPIEIAEIYGELRE
jgi:rfaE bifunctional protein kinase chain/domain